MKKTIIFLIAYLFSFNIQSQAPCEYGDGASKALYILKSSCIDPLSSIHIMKIKDDTTFMHQTNLILDTIAKNTTTINTDGALLWLDINGKVIATHYSDFTLPSYQIIGLPDSLNSRYTKTQINNLFSSYVPTIPPTTLVITGNNISTVGGNTITLPSSVTPTITASGNSTITGIWPTLNINSSFVQTVQATPPTTLVLVGQSLSTINGNSVTIPSQSIQPVTLSLTGQSLSAGFNTVTIPTYSTSYSGSTGISVNGTIITNTLPDQTTSIISANNQISISGTYPNFTLTSYIPTSNASTRAINSTTFLVSSTKDAFVAYTVRMVCATVIGATTSGGTVALQYYDGSNWQELGQIENGITGLLGSNNQCAILSGWVPRNSPVRIVTTILTGIGISSATVAYVRGRETY